VKGDENLSAAADIDAGVEQAVAAVAAEDGRTTSPAGIRNGVIPSQSAATLAEVVVAAGSWEIVADIPGKNAAAGDLKAESLHVARRQWHVAFSPVVAAIAA
jgi:hypothetical protein